jgi:YidC/Oxa1 family membrane protein insertase
VILILASILSPLEDLFRSILNWLHLSVGFSWAWSIVVLTVIVRIVLVPLTIKQIHSMQSLQAHAPEMKEIQKRYKHDKQRQQQELMRFYKENDINPFASCLPTLLQIPVFLALYFVLKGFSKNPPGGDLSWLGNFVPNISAAATSHWSGYVLLAVYVGSQVASTYFMSASAQRSQRVLMLVLPFAFLPVIARFPTGLVLYWMTTNLWTVGQGLITRTLIPRAPAPVKRSSRTPPAEERRAAEADAGPQRAPQPPRLVKRKKKGGRR